MYCQNAWCYQANCFLSPKNGRSRTKKEAELKRWELSLRKKEEELRRREEEVKAKERAIKTKAKEIYESYLNKYKKEVEDFIGIRFSIFI